MTNVNELISNIHLLHSYAAARGGNKFDCATAIGELTAESITIVEAMVLVSKEISEKAN